jgi:hypothetical protein
MMALKPIIEEPGSLDDAETVIHQYLAENGPQDAQTIGRECYPRYTKRTGKDWYMVAGWEGWARRILLMLIKRGMVYEENGKFGVILV